MYDDCLSFIKNLCPVTGLEDGTSKLPVITLYFLSNNFPVCRVGRRKDSASVASHSFHHFVSKHSTFVGLFFCYYKTISCWVLCFWM